MILKYKSLVIHLIQRLIHDWSYPWGEEQLQVLVEEGLVRGVGQTEALEECMGILHYFMHPHILILKSTGSIYIMYRVWSSLHNKRVLAWINSHEILRKLNRIIAKRYSTSLLKFSLFLNIKCVKLMLKKIRFKCAFFFVEKYMNVKKKSSCVCISGRGKMSLQFHMRSGEAPALHWGRSCSVASAVRVS